MVFLCLSPRSARWRAALPCAGEEICVRAAVMRRGLCAPFPARFSTLCRCVARALVQRYDQFTLYVFAVLDPIEKDFPQCKVALRRNESLAQAMSLSTSPSARWRAKTCAPTLVHPRACRGFLACTWSSCTVCLPARALHPAGSGGGGCSGGAAGVLRRLRQAAIGPKGLKPNLDFYLDQLSTRDDIIMMRCIYL